VEGMSLEALTPVVRRALGDDQLSVLAGEVRQFDWAAINPITRGLFRISGTARMSSWGHSSVAGGVESCRGPLT